MADETLVYTLLGEARGEGVEGMVAVANVIRNRADSGLYPSDPVDVVLQPWQFSTNNAGEGGNQAATRREVPVGSALYDTAARIVDLYIEGDAPPTDLTGGSLFYHTNGLPWRYANSVRTAYGTTQIGNHTFYPRHPVPQVDIGAADLLRGYTSMAPIPMSRDLRPGGYTQTTSQKIMALREETRLQQRMVRNATAMKLSPAMEGVTSAEAVGVTPRAPEGVDFTTQFELPAGQRTNLVRPIPMDQSSAQAREAVLAGGFGALLGKAFPMVAVPAAPKAPVAGLRLPVAPEARQSSVQGLRPGDVVADSGLIRRSVKTLKIDPATGMPVLVSEASSVPAKVSPSWTGDPMSRVKVAQQTVQQQRAAAPAWASMGGSPIMTAVERVRFAKQYEAQTKAKTASLAAPGAGLTAAQRTAMTSTKGVATVAAMPPLPRPRPATPAPVPLPREARPVTKSSSSSGSDYLPASTASLAKIMAPKTSTATPASIKAPVTGLRLPVAPSPVVKSATQSVTRTVIVHKDGTESTVQKAGSVKMAADRPSILSKPPVAGLRLPVAPKVSTATVTPQKPVAELQLSAPGAGLTAAQRFAMSAVPVAAAKPVTPVAVVAAPKKTVVSTKIVTVSKPIVKPAPVVAKPAPAPIDRNSPQYNIQNNNRDSGDYLGSFEKDSFGNPGWMD